MSPAQHHPFYDEEKVAYEADPANAVLLRLKRDGDDGFLGLVKDIIRDAPTPPRREQPFGMELPGQPADDWMRRLATICIEGKGGLFTMAPPCGHRESVEMFFRLFQPFLWSGGNVVLYFVTGRMHPGTLDVVVDWQRCVKAEASGSLDFCFFDQETGLSTGDAGFQIITKTGYLATGFYTPGGWCTKFWSNDEPPKNMTWGNFVLSLWPLKEGEEGRPANESMLKQTERSLQYWTGGVLYSTPSVLQYIRPSFSSSTRFHLASSASDDVPSSVNVPAVDPDVHSTLPAPLYIGNMQHCLVFDTKNSLLSSGSRPSAAAMVASSAR
ncbi:hypothetical protein NBRC10512_000009 [Rhodotorula toruloides]|uniref:RHTO0S04e07096g1_1 n=2 Tax=Rhodotorula toruloides TaxID=5286 RepID=A0A061APS6_RHOTO|nr:uncharacterized protein RHTO_02061 [Rhodotorula toruloides NP11]EMS21190.1 hypothetical protein RHTO_02061 [Rhodotorula toruloides NP11]CDR39619.1 RHTO0S04e07096g1_1 [Rhodotorula toruloides]